MLIENEPSNTTDFTVQQIAKIIKSTPHKVYELINAGELESYKISQRGRRVSAQQLDRFRNSGGV